MQWLSASKTVYYTVKIAPTMHQKSLFGDQKNRIKFCGDPPQAPPPVGRGKLLPTPHPLGACGASTRLAPSALGLPQTLSLPRKLAVSRIVAGRWSFQISFLLLILSTTILWFTFYTNDFYSALEKASFASTVYATANPSVRPSHSAIVSKLENAEGCGLHLRIAQCL